MRDAITVEISAHGAGRLKQFGIRNVARFRRFIRDADGDLFDRKHESKLIIIDDHGHAVAVADDAGVRTVITVLPPPETSWSDRVSTHPDRYDTLDPD
ncbi:hypothetical protein [Haloplanus sp.]|uniref:hypothetical protein n=1 Tax=Haloplanus sp. TaxID=1961696 RepID=UPI0026119665|nr:hypothetical protein [Haloplanus sp.]